jgi:hypothetical protein
MDITGKIIQILPEQRFNGKNGEVVKNMFVIEHGGQYKKKAVFGVLGEDKWKQMNVVQGADVQVSFDVDAREWNGKWFGELMAWRVQNVNCQQQAQQAAVPNAKPVEQAATQQQNGSGVSDDLPF